MGAHGVGDRPVEPELDEHGRPELADEGADVAQLAAQQLAQEAQLVAGHGGVGLEDAVDELHLEDRVRQRLGRAVVDLLGEAHALGLLGLDDAHLELGRRRGRSTSVTSVLSPRSMNSHVVSRLRIASSRRDSSTSWRPIASLERAASARARRSWRSAAPASAAWSASRAVGSAAASRGPPGRRRRRARARRGRRRAPRTGPSRRGTPGGSGRGPRAACSPRSPALQPPRRGARRSGLPRARPAVHPSRGVYRPRTSLRRPHGRFRCRGARDTRARDPEHAHVADGLGVQAVVGDRQQDLLEAGGIGVGSVEDRRPAAVVRLPTISHLAPKWVARSRTSAGVSSGRASVGTRSVSASQIGKSWITGALPSSGAPIAAISRAITS